MSQETLNNGESGLSIRTKLNSNFTELYAKGAYLSAGFITLGDYTDHSDGSITIPDEDILLFTNDIYDGAIENFTLTGGRTGVEFNELVDNDTSYIVGDYNNGNPIFKVITNVELITESAVLPYLTIYRQGSIVYILDWDKMGQGLTNKIHQRIVKTDRFGRESGIVLGEGANNTITITEGRVWNGASRAIYDGCTSETCDCSFWYPVNGVWTSVTRTAYNNTQYIDWTDSGGNLATLLPNKYTNNWIYRVAEPTGHIHYVVGDASYGSLTEARIGTEPPSLPQIASTHCLLVGRIIVKRDIMGGEVQGAFVTRFAAGQLVNHNDASNLNTGDYLHLTAAEYAAMAFQDAATDWTNATQKMTNLPTTDPTVTGGLWCNPTDGILRVSQG